MSLQITNLVKNGDASQEYLLMQATADINLINYAVVDKTFATDGTVSNVFRHFFRFPDLKVKKGDYISLRTGKGKYELTKMNSGEPLHRIYWGSDAAVWNDANAESAQILQVQMVAQKTTDNPKPAPKVVPKGFNNPYR